MTLLDHIPFENEVCKIPFLSTCDSSDDCDDDFVDNDDEYGIISSACSNDGDPQSPLV